MEQANGLFIQYMPSKAEFPFQFLNWVDSLE